MKKYFTMMLALFMFMGISIFSVSADDTETVNVVYLVDSSYEWEIHTEINFGEDAGTNMIVARTATLSDDTQVGVRVNKNVIPEGKKLQIKLADSNTFKVSSGYVDLNYTITKTTGGLALTASSPVLEIPSGTNIGSQTLYFNLNTGTGAVEIAGVYRGSVTYESAIVDA